MKSKVNEIYRSAEGLNLYDLERLIDELQVLSDSMCIMCGWKMSNCNCDD